MLPSSCASLQKKNSAGSVEGLAIGAGAVNQYNRIMLLTGRSGYPPRVHPPAECFVPSVAFEKSGDIILETSI